jgi:hypothetical protein
MLEDTLGQIDGKEFPHIIPAVAKCHLCEVVCSKGEEFSLLCYLSGYETKTRMSDSFFLQKRDELIVYT